jgi:G3E family GTPase
MTRLILVGGFLGAGKTTLLSQSAQILTDRGYRVGVITNDQGQNLVDTAVIHQQGVTVSEIAGGCFCCRFTDFQEAIQELEDSAQPDIILAEPVGSCTDLMATVIRPFLKYYGDELIVAPLTILLDPTRELDPSFSDIAYLYEKQISEADIIAISKCDLLDKDRLTSEQETISRNYPTSTMITLSAQAGDGLEEWLDICLSQSTAGNHVINVDYDIYAKAEADLGWLNGRGVISSEVAFNPQFMLESILNQINTTCQSKNVVIAHVKAYFKHDDYELKASLIQTGGNILWDKLPDTTSVMSVEFIINARVTTTPEALEDIVLTAFQTVASSNQATIDIYTLECFSPLPPEPVYHIALEDI